jgi:hypothetical protein
MCAIPIKKLILLIFCHESFHGKRSFFVNPLSNLNKKRRQEKKKTRKEDQKQIAVISELSCFVHEKPDYAKREA